MSLDGPVLMIAMFAVVLKLYLWFSEEDVIRGDVEPDRTDRLHLDDNVPQFQVEARPDGTEDSPYTSASQIERR
jgi:hypothetical protein